MHIISKFKDYYDSVAGQKGIDKTIVFERWEQKLSVSVRSKGLKQWWNPSNFPTYGNLSTKAAGHKHFSLFVVGFCGKIYIGAEVTSSVQNKYRYDEFDSVVSYIYGIDYIKEKVCEYYNDDKYFNGRRDSNLEHIMSFTTDKKMLELFYTYKTPQFILLPGEQDNLIINGCLKDIQFYKIFDPFRAFQEIEMYITGVLGINNKPMVEISDKHKIVGHGFDPKYSFRKEPEDKNKKK